jgi:hypothetical protein
MRAGEQSGRGFEQLGGLHDEPVPEKSVGVVMGE